MVEGNLVGRSGWTASWREMDVRRHLEGCVAAREMGGLKKAFQGSGQMRAGRASPGWG